MTYRTPNGMTFFYGKNGELLAKDKYGNVDEIVTMGNYCVPDDEQKAQKKQIEELRRKQERTHR